MLCVLGGGKMGSAIVSGLLQGGWKDGLTVVETDETTAASLKQRFPQVEIVTAPRPCDGTLIAVKPKDALIAASDAVDAGAKRIISIAAGVTLAKLHEAAGNRIPVIRAMPNIGALVRKSATAVCAAPPAHDADLDWAETVLGPLGKVVRVREEQMDAVTGLSGSGPAFYFLILEAMIDAGVHAGLTLDVSRELSLATLAGSAELSLGEHSPVELREMVTTPAGTTSAGLRVLEHNSVRGAIIEAVVAATERSSRDR